MMILEFATSKVPSKYKSRQDATATSLSDVRKSKLTFEEIKKMRMMHEVKKYEQMLKLKKVQTQYGKPEESQGMM